ncbi:MAG: phosphotransferase [Gammaproteobacteria bacterium]
MQKINRLLELVCKSYKLGQCLSEPEPCSGGLLHRIWRFDTTKGSYILKVLNPTIMRLPDRLARYRVTELIARAFEKTIPAIAALMHHHDPLFRYENETIMVFPYLKARVLQPTEINAMHTAAIGRVLAVIHNTYIYIHDVPPVELLQQHFSTPEILSKLSARAPDIAKQFSVCEKVIYQIISLCHANENILTNNIVISHRDCDPKNVLWDEKNQYYFIDWESAGRINKTKDLVATAIYWSLDERYIIESEHLVAFLSAYQENSGMVVKEEIEAGFYGLLGDWLGWLEFNFSRIAECEENSAEFLLGKSEAEKTLFALPRLVEQFQVLLKMMCVR